MDSEKCFTVLSQMYEKIEEPFRVVVCSYESQLANALTEVVSSFGVPFV